MKFAQRPKNKPIGATTTRLSPRLVHEILCRRAYQKVKTINPSIPPWLDIPPSQTRATESGSGNISG